jgi:RecA-family ATPase
LIIVKNVLGDLFIERGSYVVNNGPTGVGKSVLSVQIGVEAALGRETFGIKVDRPLNGTKLRAIWDVFAPQGL